MPDSLTVADKTDDSVLLAKTASRAAAALRLSNKELARVLGVSEATVSRMARSTGLPDTGKAHELAVLLARLFRSLDAIVGGDNAVAAAWLRNPNAALGARPVDKLFSVAGLVEVITYLDARRAPL